MMELTPLQKKWIDILKTTKQRQGRECLCSREEGEERYCCLGIAAKFVLNENGLDDGSGRLKFDGSRLFLTERLMKKIGLRDSGMDSCMTMNDKEGKNFMEIAVELETNPHRYFQNI
jgi:hypothetical protein